MAYRELELTLLSAQNLKNVNLITSMDVYAVVTISGDPLTRQSTAPDTYGGRNPRWNATFRFAVPPTAAAASAAGASLHVLLRSERFLGDRDVGEVVVPLADILAGAPTYGPQPTQVASYQVRKVHRWEPHGVLNVSYRLGPVVAPVLERAPDPEKQAAAVKPYAPVDLPSSYHHPTTVAYPPPPPPVPRTAAVHVAEHEAVQKSPVMAYQVVGVPQKQSPPPAKPDAYRPPPPRPAAEDSAPAPEERNGRRNGHGQAGPTHVYMGPQTQIIFGGGAPTTTTTAGLPTTVQGREDKFPAGNWATQGSYASAAESIVSPSPRGKEDRSRPSVASPVAGYPSHRLLMPAASPSSSRGSSSSSPSSPYFSAHPSPCSSAHSSTRSPYSSLAHPSSTAFPRPLGRPPAAIDDGEAARGTNNGFRSTSARGGAISSPVPASSPLVPTRHSTVVPSV